jgi:hypothetical protein
VCSFFLSSDDAFDDGGNSLTDVHFDGDNMAIALRLCRSLPYVSTTKRSLRSESFTLAGVLNLHSVNGCQ